MGVALDNHALGVRFQTRENAGRLNRRFGHVVLGQENICAVMIARVLDGADAAEPAALVGAYEASRGRLVVRTGFRDRVGHVNLSFG
jgi:hypothetical protein